jgi:hypothetical protein
MSATFQFEVEPPIAGDLFAGLTRRFGNQRALEILDAPWLEIGAIRRGMLNDGRARNPAFVLSPAQYDSAAAGLWITRVDRDGQTTVTRVDPDGRATVARIPP